MEADGLFISVAAGNGFSSYNEPGLSYPAASPYVVPVASVDDNGQLSYFSQRSDRVIAAPGRSITSTVPDYVGNGNGVDDDFASYSGTSMAAPYVAGASVLIREAYEFAGVDHVTQDDIYDVMRSTADLVYDPVTGQSYCRLNLQRAIESIMPAGRFRLLRLRRGRPGHARLARPTACRSPARSGRSTIATYFTFTAEQTGRVTLTHRRHPRSRRPTGRCRAASSPSTPTTGRCRSTSRRGTDVYDRPGHRRRASATTRSTFRLEADFLPPGGERARQQELLDQSVSAAGQWFAFTAAQDGMLTVEAPFANAKGDVDVQLYDGSQRLVGGSYSTGDAERIDVSV